jgi:hypothetical protein
VGLLSRLPSTPSALLELINTPSPYCGMGVHIAFSTPAAACVHRTPEQLEEREQYCASPACSVLHEKIRFHAEQLWPVGGSPVPASAKLRNRDIRQAFKDAGDSPPSDASIKRALEGTRFMKSRPHLRKR